MMANLYELSEDYQNIVDLLETSEDEEVIELLTEALNSLNDDIKTKVDNIVRVVRNLQSDIDALKSEEKRLAERRKATERRISNLEKYLFDFASSCKDKKIKGNLFEVTIRKNPVKVVIDDESNVPMDFVTKEVVYKIDKKSLKDFLKDNEIDGCRLVQDESLRIK